MKYRLVTQRKKVGLARASWLNSDKFISLTCPFHYEVDAEIICGEWCPHFEIEEPVTNRLRVTITCTPCRKLIAIERS